MNFNFHIRKKFLPSSFSPSMLSWSTLRPLLVTEENCQLSTSESWDHRAQGGFRKKDRFQRKNTQKLRPLVPSKALKPGPVPKLGSSFCDTSFHRRETQLILINCRFTFVNLNYSCKVTLSPKWLLVALGGSFVDGPMNRAVRDWSHLTHIFPGAGKQSNCLLVSALIPQARVLFEIQGHIFCLLG